MFLDRVKISIKAGNGGKGSTSFLRTKLTAMVVQMVVMAETAEMLYSKPQMK